MEQSVRIRLYGKPDCEQCNKAKTKLRSMGLVWDFVDVSTWLDYADDWRERVEETVSFHAAYDFYYPMPLPLFRFNDDDYLGYADGLKTAKSVSRARGAAKKTIEVERIAAAVAPVLEAVA